MDSPPPYHGLYAYVWDVAPEDPDGLAAELNGWGIDTLCLAASYHAGKFIRPHATGSRVFFPEDGTVHCATRPERYGTIKPRPSREVAGDAFGRFAARPDLHVTAWTVLLHNTPLGTAHPDCVARNAFGDPYWYSLCPAHPDVQEYAVALCADIADRYPVRGLVLETPGWLPYAHGYHHEFALIGANPWLDAMLGLCFCPHCLEGAGTAGIDASSLRRRVADRIDGSLRASLDTPADIGLHWLQGDLVDDAELVAYLRWRQSVVTALVRRIRAAVRPDAELFVIPSVRRPSAAGWIEGSDLPALAQAADGLEICFYEPSSQRAAADFAEVRRRVGASAAIRCVLRPGPPDAPEEGGFAQTVVALDRAGAAGFGFYNYGHLRRANLDWIGRALHGRGKGNAHASRR